MVKDGEIKAVRYASRTMIPLTELARLLELPNTASLLSSSDAWAADHPSE